MSPTLFPFGFLSDHRHRPPPRPRSKSAHGRDARLRWPLVPLWFVGATRRSFSQVPEERTRNINQIKAGLSQSTARLRACHKVARLDRSLGRSLGNNRHPGPVAMLPSAESRPLAIPSGLARVTSARTNTPAGVFFALFDGPTAPINPAAECAPASHRGRHTRPRLDWWNCRSMIGGPC